MENVVAPRSFKSIVGLILMGAVVLLGLWFTHEIIGILFLFFLAIVLTLVLNAPTMWLVNRKVPRTGAALLVFFAMLIFIGAIGWVIIPKVLEQVSAFVINLPQYSASLQRQLADLLEDYPALQRRVLDNAAIEDNFPSIRRVLTSVGSFSVSLISGVFMAVVFFSIVLYMLIEPAPLIETYLTFFAREKRAQAAHALARASTMVVGWMYSNIVVGSMEAVAVFFFLRYMQVPGVWVWAALALFAELVPKLGPYIMAIPPILVALSVDPVTALWVLIFYVVLNELMGNLVVPRVRASTMNLHPVSSLFVMIAVGGAFGIMGALIATPLTAFIKAFYETFYLDKVSKDNLDQQVEIVLNRDA